MLLHSVTLRLLSVLVLVAALLSGGLVRPAPSEAAVVVPAVPSGLPTAIEDLARWVGQNSCDPRAWSGTVRLAKLLTSTYAGTSYGMNYDCGTNGERSEHYEGRAIDWHVSLWDRTQAAQAGAFINWLFATDKAGNKFAMARRLGIMYVIWNNKFWGSYNNFVAEPYEDCGTRPSRSDDSYCHRNHVHISLSYNGAIGRTSFWSKRVFNATDYGPCAPRGLNWSPDYTAFNPTPCLRYASVAAPSNASTTHASLVRYSGAEVAFLDRGPIVNALQAGLHLPIVSYFGTTMRNRLIAWQSARGLKATGTSTPETWLRLLAENKPR